MKGLLKFENKKGLGIDWKEEIKVWETVSWHLRKKEKLVRGPLTSLFKASSPQHFSLKPLVMRLDLFQAEIPKYTRSYIFLTSLPF